MCKHCCVNHITKGDESDGSSASEPAAIGTQETVFTVMLKSDMLKAMVELAEIGTQEIVYTGMMRLNSWQD